MTQALAFSAMGHVSREEERRPALVAFAGSCFLISGATALVYEIVWLRQLTIVFGSTSVATSTVFAAFMGGLALGALLVRRRPRPGRPLLLIYGLLEIGLGLSALAARWLFTGIDAIFDALYQAFSPGQYTAVLLRFILSAAVFFVPTACMGATLPVLSAFVSEREDRIGQTVGLLYGLNTVGAVAGALAGGFFLLPRYGVAATLLGTAALNVVLGIAVAVVSRRAVAGGHPGPALPQAADETRLPYPGGVLLAAIAVSGATALTYEVGWTRLLDMAVGTSVYAVTTMLATYLCGLALGGAAFGALADRVTTRGRMALLATLQAAAGVAALLTLRWLQELPMFYASWFRHFVPAAAATSAGDKYHVVTLVGFALAAVVMLPPTFFLGGMLPVIVRAMTEGRVPLGRTVGRVYALNTVGAIVGSLAAGLVLIPLLGIRATLVSAAAANLVVACTLLLGLRPLAFAVRTLGVVLVLGLGILVAGTLPPLDARVFSAAIHRNVERLRTGDRADFARLIQPYAVLFHRDGITATVTVGASLDDDRNRWMAIDGQVDASTFDDLPTQVLLGQIPMLLALRTENVLVIGLGSGMTLGSVLQHPVARVTTVEIEPAVHEACRAFFAHANHHALDDPRVSVVFDDARTFLRHVSDRYDVVIAEPSYAWRSGSARLFTREFWEQGRRALRDDGVFGQWMHLYSLDMRDAQSLVRTFHEVFPHTYVFELAAGQDLLLLGSARPLVLDLARLRTRLAVPAVASDLRRIAEVEADFPDMRRPASLLATLRLGPDDIAAFVDDAPRNTDDGGFVEFSAPRSIFVKRGSEIAAALARHIDVLRYVDGAEADPSFITELAKAYLVFRQPVAARRIAVRLDPSLEVPRLR